MLAKCGHMAVLRNEHQLLVVAPKNTMVTENDVNSCLETVDLQLRKSHQQRASRVRANTDWKLYLVNTNDGTVSDAVAGVDEYGTPISRLDSGSSALRAVLRAVLPTLHLDYNGIETIKTPLDWDNFGYEVFPVGDGTPRPIPGVAVSAMVVRRKNDPAESPSIVYIVGQTSPHLAEGFGCHVWVLSTVPPTGGDQYSTIGAMKTEVEQLISQGASRFPPEMQAIHSQTRYRKREVQTPQFPGNTVSVGEALLFFGVDTFPKLVNEWTDC